MVGSEKGKLKKEEVNAVGGNEPVGTKPNYASLGLTKPLAEGGAAPAAPFNAFAGNGIVGRFGPVGDKASLSLSEPTKPLIGGASAPVGDGAANVSVVQNAPTFQKDDTKKDGGFFGWLGGLIKKRPGIRSGESADEYDERMTRNKMRLATLADAIRHMGNIYNTSKGAPLQRFNNPAAELQANFEKRKAERARQAALDADAAYKDANLRMKQNAAEAERDYNNMVLDLRGAAQKLAEERFGHQKEKDEHDTKLSDDKFEHQKEQDKIKNKQAGQRIAMAANRAKAKSGSGRGGKTSGVKYWFEDKNGKMHYQPNKTMWEQEYYREYGALPYGESNTSVSTKAYNSKGEEVTTTRRKKGPSMTSQAAQQQNKARALRKNNAKPKKGGWASGFKL